MSADMSHVIVPKSDQLNADDLIAGPITIKIRDVKIRVDTKDQPVSIFYEGDNDKPYKSCKSMNRVMVIAWGSDARKYIGRSMTLYRDASVKWAGMEVGGIRISHMSHIDSAITMALTATKGSRKPYTVKPLVLAENAAAKNNPAVAALADKYKSAANQEAYSALEAERRTLWPQLAADDKAQLKQVADAAKARLATPSATSEGKATKTFDAASAISQLNACSDLNELQMIWDAMVDGAKECGIEVPVSVEDARNMRREALQGF